MKLPQLTLRDLFWLVLVAALGCAWWLDHHRQATAILLFDAIKVESIPTHTVPIGDADVTVRLPE